MTSNDGNSFGSFLLFGTSLCNLLRGLDGPGLVCVIPELISMDMGMGVVTGREVRVVLGVVLRLRMRMVKGMVLIQFFLSFLVRADISSKGCLGIIRPTIRPVFGCHNQYSPPGDKNASPAGTGPGEIRWP
jgi:hypothetical protein